MRVLVVGISNSFAIEPIYVRYLKAKLESIELFDMDKFKFQKNSISGKVGNRIFKKYLYRKINNSLIDKIKLFKPDIVWIFKGIEIQPETLIKIKKISNVKLINYNPDHPFIRSFRSSGGENVEKCVPLYDLHFCYSLDLCEKITTQFNIQTVHLPFGFDLKESDYAEVISQNEILKIALVGNPDKKRAEIIKILAKNQISIDVYGFGWGKWLTADKFITIFNVVEKIDFWKTIYKYRVQLNIFREHNFGSHNMRSFEIPSVGGIQLAPFSNEHCMYFVPQKEIFLYNSVEEIITQAQYLLSLTQESASYLRDFARDRSILSDYSYEGRAKLVFQTFQNLLN